MAADADIPVLDDFPDWLGAKLGEGTYGIAYELEGHSDKIVKVLEQYRMKTSDIKSLVQEVTIQQKLYEKVPGSCPKIYTSGEATDGDGYLYYVIIMEKCEGTARSWLKNNGRTDAEVLNYLEQVATILKKSKPFGFNHRDLKSDNIMYKSVVGRDKNGKLKPRKVYLLIDFGFSCATFDGVKYEGTTYFKPGIKCFRESRDLAMLIFELLHYKILSPDMTKFIQLLLTFDYKGKKCDMSQGCLPDFNGEWLKTYNFLDRDDVENPNTTPDGLLNAINAYRTKGIKACEKDGFVVDPVKDVCVPSPEPPAVAAMKPPVTPGKGHMASPVVLEVSPSPAEAVPAPSLPGSYPQVWTGGKKHRAYSGGYTRRRARAARAPRKTLRHKRGTRK
jgi:serine/threonine protein kinase